MRPRWLGGASLGAPVQIPHNAVPMGEFVRGEAALQHNDIDTATDAFEKAVHADPDTPMLRLRLATLYVRNGKLEKAREQCERVVAAEPDNMDALALLAGIDSALDRDDDAIAIYERVLAHDPDVQEAYLYLGALYGKRGQVDQAIATLQRLVARNPNSLLGYYYLGRVYAATGQLDQAEKYYLEALKLSPQSELVLTDLAAAYEMQGRGPKAEELYAAHPGAESRRAWWCGVVSAGCTPGRSVSTKRSRSSASSRRSTPIRARRARRWVSSTSRRASSSAPRPSSTWCWHRRRTTCACATIWPSVHAELGQTQRALDGFAAIPPDSEYYVDAQVRRAYLLQKDDPAEAIRGLEAALTVHPDSLELMAYLASLYRQEKQYDRAVALLEQIVAQLAGQRSLSLHPRRGVRRGQRQGSRHHGDAQGDRAEPAQRRRAQLPRATRCADMGVQLDEAERLIRRALELQPNDGIYIDSLGWVYYQRGDYQRAVEQLERAVELAGEDPTIVEHLGDAYQRLGQSAAALRVYRDALAALEGVGADRAAEGQDPGPRRHHQRERRPSVSRALRPDLGAALVLALAGCATLRHRPPPLAAGVTAERLLDGLAARRAAITSLRARARLKAGLAGLWTRQAVLVQRPGEVRMDVMSPFGLALAVGTQRDMLWAYPPSRAGALRGRGEPAQPGALSRRAGLGAAIWSTSCSACRPCASRPVPPSCRGEPTGALVVTVPFDGGAQRPVVRSSHARSAPRGRTTRRRRSRSRSPSTTTGRLPARPRRLGAPSSARPRGWRTTPSSATCRSTTTLFSPPSAPRVLPLEAAATG